MALARRFFYSRSTWNRFKGTQLKIQKRAEERNDEERDADYDGDEDFDVGGGGQPLLKKVLQLLTPVPTRWNSLSYTIKRALVLEDLLLIFSNSERARNGKSPLHQAPSHPKGKCCFGVTLLSGPLPILLMLGSCVPTATPQIPKINLEY